jgi:ureidoglycolate hydrolase
MSKSSFSCSVLAVPLTVTVLVKHPECRQHAQPMCMSTVIHTACGTRGESVVSKDELRTLQLCVVKLTSTWSASPRPNSLTSTWHMVQHIATAGKQRGFITSFFRTECVQIIVRLLLSTVTYGKQVHLQ